MDDVLLQSEDKMKKVIENMESRFLNVRAGRANPRMLDKVVCDYYGVSTPLIQLATISVPEARKLVVKPYDRGSINAIEKGICEANIGIMPNNNGEIITLVIPELTEDRRREYVKEAKKIAEDAKIALRNIRQDANNLIKKSDSTEDEKIYSQDNVQDLIVKYNKIIDDKEKEKEKELMQV